MKWTKFSTIRLRLMGITVVIIFFLVLTGVFSYHYFSKIEEYTELTKPVNNFYGQLMIMRRMEKNFLMLDRNNSDFVKTGSSEHVRLFDSTYKSTEMLLEKVMTNKTLKNIDNKALTQRFDSIGQLLGNYMHTFGELKQKVREKGNNQHGVAGDIYETGQKISTITIQLNNVRITDFLNEMQQLETMYLLHKDPVYIKQVVEKTETFLLELQSDSAIFSNLEGTKKEFIQSLQAYILHLQQYVLIDQAIGLNQNTGLIGEIRQTARKIETLTNQNITALERISRAEIQRAKRRMILLVILFTLASAGVLISITQSIVRPINSIKNFILELMKGKLPEKVKRKTHDEIRDMLRALNTFVDGLKQKAAFAQEIEKGKLNADFEPLSKEDALGISLLEMRQSLQKAEKEEQKRQEEDRKNNWINTGLTRFSDILRNNNSDLQQLASDVIKNLVRYLNANQGALFIISDSEEGRFVELKAAFAYDRRRKMKKRFEMDEGLIGRVVTEKETIYMTSIPESYIKITSGLGGENPKTLLIVPLILNEEVYGVVEIASFKPIEDYQIKFVQEVSESIASTLAATKANEHTQKLLEQSQEQAEELAAQEEEMRQNLEELQATQEEASRKEARLTGLVNAIDSTTYAIEFDLDGHIIRANDMVEKITGIESEELLGVHIKDYLNIPDEESFGNFWAALVEGTTQNRTTCKDVTGKTIWLKETYTPIFDNDENIDRILNIAFDITETKELEESLEMEREEIQVQENVMNSSMQELEKAEAEIEKNKHELSSKKQEIDSLRQAVDYGLMRVEVDTNADILFVNENYAQALEYTVDELIGENAFLFIFEEEEEKMRSVFEELLQNKPYKGKMRRKTKSGKEKYFVGTLFPNADEATINKIIFLGYDISENEAQN